MLSRVQWRFKLLKNSPTFSFLSTAATWQKEFRTWHTPLNLVALPPVFFDDDSVHTHTFSSLLGSSWDFFGNTWSPRAYSMCQAQCCVAACWIVGHKPYWATAVGGFSCLGERWLTQPHRQQGHDNRDNPLHVLHMENITYIHSLAHASNLLTWLYSNSSQSTLDYSRFFFRLDFGFSYLPKMHCPHDLPANNLNSDAPIAWISAMVILQRLLWQQWAIYWWCHNVIKQISAVLCPHIYGLLGDQNGKL